MGEGAAPGALGPWGRGSGAHPDAGVPRLGPAGVGVLRASAAAPGDSVRSPTGQDSAWNSLGFPLLVSCLGLFLHPPPHRNLVLNLRFLSGRTVIFSYVFLA